MKQFDIAPFSLPNTEPGEIRFEESRDIRKIALRFKGAVPRRTSVEYLRGKWPGARPEANPEPDLENPARFGWLGMDDWFNPKWQQARIKRAVRGRTVTLTFHGVQSELADAPDD